MNKDIVEKIKFVDENKIIVNEELNKIITVKVDASLVNNQNKISDELIELGYNDVYKSLTKLLKITVRCLKMIDLNKPFKQNIISKIFEIPLDVDFFSLTTILYTKLTDMVRFINLFDELFKKINEIEKKLSDNIAENNFNNNTTFNNTLALVQIKGLKQMKLSLLNLYECYRLILKNPQIKDFYTKWLDYQDEIRRELNLEISNYKELMLSKIHEL